MPSEGCTAYETVNHGKIVYQNDWIMISLACEAHESYDAFEIQ